MSYPQRWTGFWVIVSATGVGLALLQWSWLTVTVAYAATGILMTVFIVATTEVPDGSRQMSALTRHVVAIGAELAAGLMAFVAVANLSKLLSVCLLVAAGVSSPWLVGRLRRRSSSIAREAIYSDVSWPPAERTTAAPLPNLEVRGMTTKEVCHAWRKSFLLLESATSILERMRIVGCRQLYLDELERRNPRGLRAWLDSGARAAGSPERYVADHPDYGHPDAA